MFAAQTAATTLKLHVTLRKAYGFGSMVMSLLGFDNQGATFAYPGATMGAMSAAALSRASHADEDIEAKLRKAEVEASFRSAGHLGFDDLISPVETRDAGKSPYGVHDLAGNASEWVSDWFASGFVRGHYDVRKHLRLGGGVAVGERIFDVTSLPR